MTTRSRSDPRRSQSTPRTSRGTTRRTERTETRTEPSATRAKPTETRAKPAEIADAPLLALARAIAEIHATEARAPLQAALERLAQAYGDDGAAAAALFDTWLRRHREGGREKTRTLALAWAREQVRLALQEVLEHDVARGRVRADVDVEDLAWILLACCEAIAHEPAGGAHERIRLLLALAASR